MPGELGRSRLWLGQEQDGVVGNSFAMQWLPEGVHSMSVCVYSDT